MRFFRKTKLLLIIIIFGSVLRLYQLSSIPTSLNPDELAIGYNAYSILKSGADEWGKILPLSLKSFGDWKQPVYPFITVPFIAILGLTEFSVRIPAAISGIIGIILIYHITKLLFKKDSIALFSSFFFAVSPWSIFFSRGAFDPNLATTLFLAGVLFLLKYFENKKKGIDILASVVFFGLSIFTYHPFTILTPLFVIFSFIYLFKKFNKNRWFYISLATFTFFFLFYLLSAAESSISKLSSVGVFNNRDIIYYRVEKVRSDGAPENSLFKYFLHNKYLGIPYHIAQNYLLTFSPKFLFEGEGTKLFYETGNFGKLYLFDALLLAAGVTGIFWKREKSIPILLIWLIVTPIPSAITKEAPSVSRLIGIMPLFTIVGGYGAYSIYEFIKQRGKLYLFAGLLLLFIFFMNFVFFLDAYFIHMNLERARFFHYGYKEAVEISRKYPNRRVVMAGPDNFPYISFLFYEKYDPIKFRQDVKYYLPTKEGFYFVKSFGKYEFPESIDRKKLKPNTLYIDTYKKGDINTINYLSGEPAFAYFIND